MEDELKATIAKQKKVIAMQDEMIEKINKSWMRTVDAQWKAYKAVVDNQNAEIDFLIEMLKK